MKDIFAIIRQNKVNTTKKALAEVGLGSITATGNVLGRGKGMVDYRILEGAKEGYEEAIDQLGQGPRLVPKRIISIVTTDKNAPLAIKTIIDANQTGSSGDGKVFVLPVEETYRVRTSEEGESTLD